jgi:Bacterial PH domain
VVRCHRYSSKRVYSLSLVSTSTFIFVCQVKRGKRKGSAAGNPKPISAALVPEQVFYEGPPAISETILPTLSILTVVGIIPAAAAWARQAWVKYRITNRRIRVNSGINGQDMAEIVYPDICEIRTVRRLFGDGDMVCTLRDGAKFEMRNIPNFDDALEFILQQCDKTVVQQYRNKGDVTNP